MEQLNAWQQQKKLMEISSQYLPARYELNKTSLLYSALVLEETSELFDGIQKVLARVNSPEHQKLLAFYTELESIMHTASKNIRDEIAVMPEFNAPLVTEETVELADATTDITVVNCGFALSIGVDGAACYSDVAGSNLSKANPVTGVIDKTADGKWIKGTAYKEPNLTEVLFKE